MKRQLSFLLLFLATCLEGWGQCDLPVQRDAFPPTTPMNVFCVVHVIRDSQGNGPTFADATAMMQKVRADFLGISAANYIAANCPGPNCPTAPTYSGTNVCNTPAVPYPTNWADPASFNTNINLCWDIVFHDNDAWVYANPEIPPLSNLSVPNTQVVNVWVNEFTQGPFYGFYFVPTYQTWDGAKVGYASCNGAAWNRDLAHELGHYFGLGHTFNSFCDEVGVSACVAETVNDLIADTDPDPNFGGWGSTYCNVGSMTLLDRQVTCPPPVGTYTASFTTRMNIMQYGNEGCNVLFTPMQGRRMRCRLTNFFPGVLAFGQSVMVGGTSCPTPCEADFQATQVNGCPLVPVTFTDLSGDQAGITSWSWDFGDGSPLLVYNSAQPTVQHTYTTPGTYTVSLSITCAGGGTSTRQRTAYLNIISGGVVPPYLQDFDQRVFPHAGWETNFTTPPLNSFVDHNWSRIEGGVFTTPFNCSNLTITSTFPWHKCTPDLLGRPAQFDVSTMSPTGYVVNPGTGDPNACAGCVYGADGAISNLLTPFFDISSIQNPIMSFHYSHNPSGGSTLGPCDCNYAYPGMPSGTSPASFSNTCYWSTPTAGCNCNTPGSPACTSAVPSGNCPENPTLNVYVSDDCGSNWTLLWSATGAALNTVPGHPCTSYGYFPLTAGVWQQHQEDLCQYLGSSYVRFRFEVVQQRYSGNIFIDDFYIGPDPNTTNTVSVTPNAVNTCSSVLCTGSVSAVPSGGTAPYSYTLTGVGYSSTNGTGNFTGLCAGNYLLAVTDNNALCTQVPVTIGITPSLTVTSVITDATCQSANGSVKLITAPGVPDFTFELCEYPAMTGCQTVGPVSAASALFNGLAAGTYAYLVTDQGGNCASGTVTVGSTTNQTVSANASFNCATGQATIEFTSPGPGSGYTYTVTSQNPLPTFSFTNTTGLFNGLLPGSYDLYADDGLGNCGSGTVVIPQSTPLTFLFDYPNCGQTNGNVQITFGGGTAPFNYQVYENNGGIPPLVASGTTTGATVTLTGLSPATYTVVADDGGTHCGTGTFNIAGTQLPLSGYTSDPTCSGCDGYIELYGFIPITYAPITANLTPISPVGPTTSIPWTGPSTVFSNLCPGTYEATVTTGAGYCFTQTFTLVAPSVATLSHTVTTTDAYWCLPNGEATFTLSGTAPYLAQLFDLSGSLVAMTFGVPGPTITFSGLPPGTYNYFLQDAIGCAFGTITIGVSGVPIANAGPDASVCIGQSITLNGTSSISGLNSQWYDPTGAIIGSGPSVTFNPTLSGDYKFEVSDPSSSCITSDVVHVDALNCCSVSSTYTMLPVNGNQPTASSMGAVPTGSTIYIHDELLVDASVNWVNCQVLLNTDAKIVVQPGAVFTANTCTFNSCDQMWEGITNDGSTAVVSMTGNEINDAKKALQFSGTQLSLTLQQNVFDLNHIHASFDNLSSGSTYLITGNQFLGNPISLSPHSGTVPFTGIEVTDCEDVTIGSGTSGAAGINRFDHVAQGIRGLRSNVIVTNNKFDYIKELPLVTNSGISVLLEQASAANLTSQIGGPLSGESNEFFLGTYGVVANDLAAVDVIANQFVKWGRTAITFHNLGSQVAIAQKNNITGWSQGVMVDNVNGTNWGVFSNQMMLAAAVVPPLGVGLSNCVGANLGEVRSNQMRHNGDGIVASNCTDVEIASNIITLGAITVPPTDLFGIHVVGGSGNDLFQNLITQQGPGSSAIEYGIRVDASPNGQVYCNDLKGWERTIAFDGNSQPTAVRYNSLRNGNYGIVLQNQGQIGPQIGPNNGPLNEFVGGGWTAKLATQCSPGGLSSPYYYPSAGGAQYNPGTPGTIPGGGCANTTFTATATTINLANFDCTTMPAKAAPPAPLLQLHELLLSAFPSPTLGKATILLQQDVAQEVHLRVVSPLGVQVWEATLNQQGETALEVDFSHLSSGVYTITATADGQMATAKLVVQH